MIAAGIGLVAHSVPARSVAADGPTQAAVPQEAERIEVAALRERMAKGDVVVIDTRSAEAYALSHIPGSISMPYASIEARLNELPKNKLIAAYCT